MKCLDFLFFFKYYANRTSYKVKTKCIELIYSWFVGLPQKTKIKEAYDMQKRQGIVQANPVNVDKVNKYLGFLINFLEFVQV